MKTLQTLVNQKTAVPPSFASNTIIEVHCPNCGSHAERHLLASEKLIRTQCAACDYLMITCSETSRVVEAYAPGIFAR